MLEFFRFLLLSSSRRVVRIGRGGAAAASFPAALLAGQAYGTVWEVSGTRGGAITLVEDGALMPDFGRGGGGGGGGGDDNNDGEGDEEGGEGWSSASACA